MKKNLNADIKLLVKKIKNRKIPITAAIQEYCQLVSEFHETAYYSTESSIDIEQMSSNGKLLFEKNIILERRINKLEKILVLQELGVSFSPEELRKLIDSPKPLFN